MSVARNLTVEERIRELLVSRLQVAPETLQGQDDPPLLGQGIGLDSVEAMVLATEVEAAFGIRFEDEEINSDLFQTLSALANRVAAKQPLIEAQKS